MSDNLIFCKVDEYGFPHWNGVNFFRWYYLPSNWTFSTGKAHLWLYKTAWLVHHREMLKQYAREAQVPLLLLAGVAAAEVGGTPERFKSIGVLQLKQVLETILRKHNNKISNSTSVGSVAIQLGVAARTIGVRPDILTSYEQFQLSRCLLDNSFNIRVVAFHLRDLIMYDYPDVDTANLTDEQIILAGSRYNRGLERQKQDFIDSIVAPKGAPGREYSEYGRRIVEKKEAIMKIMRGGN
ncbi:hypothetical protein [Citrobacter sp. MNAZ 1397]|uniref:hypothetical protein n=1 Tax=Citrobacter sp. MNAZ 1397 TaxID=2911205 RepID=UPI002026676F|nr:hypothetical protein [Citrobacter sp. MNAZ 1397]MCL9672531.1 hypothetical protein [Citrobacter sp. MNAZ 1397]